MMMYLFVGVVGVIAAIVLWKTVDDMLKRGGDLEE